MLKQAVAAFLHELADVRLASAHTVAAYRRDLERFSTHCGAETQLSRFRTGS